MSKINKKSINYKLKILTILAFVLVFGATIIPAKIYAQAGYNFNYDTFGGYGNNYSYGNPAPTPVYYSASATPITVYSATPTVYSSDSTGNQTKSTAVTKTTVKKSAIASKSLDSSLAANVIFGSNSFMPSGLIQWILFAIFVLIIVILIRKVFSGEKDYHATPMKHE